MQLLCKTCGAPLRAENINLDDFLGKCEYCNSVSYFGEEMRPERASAEQYNDRYHTRRKDDVGRPDRFEVDEQWGELTVRYRWFTPAIIALALFCLVWDGFLVFWYAIGFTQGAPRMMFLFPLLHVAIGAGMTYFAICCFVNATEIRVTKEELAVTHGPLPCGKNQHLRSSELEQLYCQEDVRHGKNGTRYSYNVMARLSDGSKQKLLSGFDDASQAIYLERLIEKHLELEDRQVGDEYRA